MLAENITWSAPPFGEPRLGILFFSLFPDFEMEDAARHGVAAFADDCPLRESLPVSHRNIGKVGIDCMESSRMTEDDEVSVRRKPVDHRDLTVGNAFYEAPGFDGDVDTGVLSYGLKNRMYMIAKMRDHGPC